MDTPTIQIQRLRTPWIAPPEVQKKKRGWIESSLLERLLANFVADEMMRHASTAASLEILLEELADSIIYGNCNARIKHILSKAPSLLLLQLQTPFPKEYGDLTSNFFNTLAAELSARLSNPLARGAVGTPAVLATDMVAYSAAAYLSKRIDAGINEILSVISSSWPRSHDLYPAIAKHLREMTWYDPCVGSGVFPLSILTLLQHFGLTEKLDIVAQIKGCDIDRLALTAAKIRTALFISTSARIGYREARRNVDKQFILGSSLTSFTEQKGLFDFLDEGKFDVVIGNPPYVRSERMDTETKDMLSSLYPSISGGKADLYVYFISHGLNAIKSGGVLCYISPANFQKSNYGRSIRKYISDHASVEALFDFDELPVFEEAAVHSSVYILEKGGSQQDVGFFAFSELPNEQPLMHGIGNSIVLPRANISKQGWILTESNADEILQLISRESVPLHVFCGQIYSGIKTGHQEAFCVSKEQAEAFLSDPASHSIPKKLLRPVSIRKWRANWDGSHLLLVKKGEKLADGSALMSHFHRYEKELKARTDISDHPTWYGLRDCSYYEIFSKPKIIYPDISTHCRFALDADGHLLTDGAFIIPSSDYLLLGLLNSCVGAFYFRTKCSSIGNPNKRGRLRFKKAYVSNFPIPKLDSTNEHLQVAIREIVQKLLQKGSPFNEKELDELALRLYSIPEEHWPILLSFK